MIRIMDKSSHTIADIALSGANPNTIADDDVSRANAALIARAPATDAALRDAVEAMEEIERYVTMRDANPMHSMDDQIHGIHSGTEWEASLCLSSLRRIITALTRARAAMGCGE